MKAIEYAITELNRSMIIAAGREEFQSAADMKRIKEGLENYSKITFTENEISQLQSKVHEIVGDGEVMQLIKRFKCALANER